MRKLEIVLAIILIATLYMMPAGIAMLRDKNNKLPIFIINVFFGWTLILWVIILAWSLMKD